MRVVSFSEGEKLPLSMAALPDLMAKEAMLAMTSGRASKMIRRTPIGQLTRSRIRPSSSLVRRVILPTELGKPKVSYHFPEILLPGSSKSRTLRIPWSISSHFPFFARSSLPRMAWLRLPSAAAFFADSRSFAFAARISFLAAPNSRCIAVRASLRASVRKTARVLEAREAALATSSGEAFESDIVDADLK